LKKSLAGKVVLVTGASRGIGAAIARLFALRGANVVINYRSKVQRAEDVARQVRELGSQALLMGVDITDQMAVERMANETREAFGKLDFLVLNASGGMEKDKPPSYPMELNLHAQLRTVDALLPLINSGGCIVFVTSHVAHFCGQQAVAQAYAAVAESKKAGELALLARVPEFNEHGVRLVVVSGDMIEGTITAKLLERTYPELGVERRSRVRVLPTIEEFAEAIVSAATDPSLPSGHVKLLGEVTQRRVVEK
jgi:NAD(P)-dependent dehydrogenase (short-subunit alcohol dehydrogenase family)